MSDSNIKDSSSLLNEARSQLAQGNLGMALARAMDSSDIGNPDASLLVALMYFSATGIQRNLDQASFYAKRYVELAPNGVQKKLAESIIDGTVGTENAKRIIFGSKEPYGKAYATLGDQFAGGKPPRMAITLVISIAVFLALFGGGYFYLQSAKPTIVKSTTQDQLKDEHPSRDVKSEDSKNYEFKSGDVSVTVTPDGQRIIKSGDLEIRTPRD